MIVVCCRQMPDVDFIRPCIASIREHMPQESLCVVDSDSPDKSYMADVGAHAVILDVKNRHYEAGAWWTAFNCFPDEDYFYFLHDSMIVQAPLPQEPLVIPGHLDEAFAGCQPIHQNLIARFMALTDYGTPPTMFFGCSGNLFFCERALMQRLKDHGADRMLPTDKYGAEAMERVWGILFMLEGFDVRAHSWGRSEHLYADPNGLPVRKLAGRRR